MANNNPSNSMRFRTKIVMTAVFVFLFGAVIANFFYISVLNNKKYQDMANDQHFASITISAHRGSIFDAKGNALAKSASVYKVFLDPSKYKEEIKELQAKIDKRSSEKASGKYTPQYDEEGKEIDPLPDSADKFEQDAITLLSQKLDIEPDKVKKAMADDSQWFELQKQVEKPVADELLEFFNQYGLVSLNIQEDTKRYYPQNELAASVIGFTTDDGNGIYGLESYYNEYLAGVDGKTISAMDSNGNELPYKYSKTYAPKNGDDVYLTIDMNIQYSLEKHLKEMVENHKVKNRGCAILMDAQTGAIYGMATYPSFDLNKPYEISDAEAAEKIKAMTNDDEINKASKAEREKQWRNKCISERYEPGSVFKVVTSASAMEEDKIDFKSPKYVCDGAVELEGAQQPVRCHKRGGHGAQTFQEALTHSCNPAFMKIGEDLGQEMFCYYCEAFGLGEPTGIDLPAESRGDIFNTDTINNVNLAVGSFGQGETITPIEMITSYCAAINGGYLLQPYVVDRVVDEYGNVVLKNERTVRRQVVSEETSAKMRDALYHVVTDSDGGNVKIMGYKIGGKSGTSQRLMETSKDGNVDIAEEEKEEDQEYGASYVCFTPVDDPKLVLLVLADMPDNSPDQYYGSVVAVPTARDILTDVLHEMGMSPEYSDEELKDLDIKVPLLEGPIDDAKKTLEGMGIDKEHVKIVGNGIEVVAQSPTTGSFISKDGFIYLYTEKGPSVADYVEVPDLKSYDPENANYLIYASGLNYITVGASTSRANAYVSGQNPEPGTKVPPGTTIELEFTVYEDGG
ncbi:MAG: PASTA domain-containing protein [Ruminococcus sp.]|nr:PASTA domain-containing protein [Ruminococcus sp.]